MLDQSANLNEEKLELKRGICERLELEIRRFHGSWARAIIQVIAYTIAYGIPWLVGFIEIVEAVKKGL